LKVNEAAQTPTEAVKASGAVEEKLISFLNRYFSELEKKVAHRRSDESGIAAMMDHVKSSFLENIQEMRESG